MNKNNHCNNCGKPGHLFNHCKMPITSTGVIAFRYTTSGSIEYLLIRRKETLGYIDFMRGKYSVQNKDYIMNMFKQMTEYEKGRLLTVNFDTLWRDIWGEGFYNNRYKLEESISREKYNSLVLGIVLRNDFYTLEDLIQKSRAYPTWTEPEWGFPKGRRNSVLPFEETFMGSNYVSYKHKYFLVYMNYCDTLNMDNFQLSEVSKMEWGNIDICMDRIRDYNLEKRRIIANVDDCLKQLEVYQL